ncbi:MAG: ABC transporter permease [Lautropia sp.]
MTTIVHETSTAAVRKSPGRNRALLGLVRAAGLLGLLSIWQIASTTGWVNAAFLPAPIDVVVEMKRLLEEGLLIEHIAASLVRVSVGFAIAAAVGIALGVLMGMSRWIDALIGPSLELIRPISPVAWIPLAILWFGLGNGPAWFVIFLAAFFPIVTNAVKGVRSVAVNDLRAAACCGIRGFALARKVVLPSSMPDIMAGLRIGLGIAWMAVIAAELVASQKGLGYLIWSSRQLFDARGVMVGMVTIGIVGLTINYLMEHLERLLTPWRYPRAARRETAATATLLARTDPKEQG